MTTAIVCGGRDYADAARVKRVLDAAVERMGLHTIIEGGAKGADTLAREWASARDDISVIAVPAQWDAHDSAAGPMRNTLMLDMLTGADGDQCVIAFPGGTGTANMISQSKKRRVTVHEING